MHRLRHRHRVARLIARAHGASNAVVREWRWALRDLHDFRAELTTYFTLTPQQRRRPDGRR